ncbi:MAG TPA: phytanoyl-CoA dioxygenase family protein, partial [Enhygromyxa sp.]|nr:phytanoyl-CoA dioxygenase family protein [Enhygromyxa sp.]
LGVELDELLTRAPTASLARTLRARLHLRLDQLDPAAAVLADASDDALAERWALLLARGRAAEIVAAPLPASASVRVIRLRAEALLEVGELEAAAELARTAAQRSPRGSAGAALLGILIDAQLSGQGPSRERFADLYRLAPGLLSDAARELELALWIDDGLIDDRAALLQCCERARRMLTADRGVRLWYATHSGDGEPRLRCNFARNHTPAAHDEDREDLEQAARLLTRALDKRSQSSARRRAASARTLDDDQIERFIADGYVHLRGAFPRELAQAVVSGAQRRLCEQPERWLQGERAAELAELLRSYDPDDPQTWPEGRVDLLGDRRFAIGSFSPDCERAVMRLLGGPQRVRTYSWADNLIIQFPTRSELGVVAPQPDQHSWHLDAPQVDTRLDNIRAGLLVFVLFGDIQPSSGNTWLALDSPARVARRLAASPDGVDFCELEMAPTITRECQRFFELTGEAGDIFLVHPLMLHSASPNPSPRVRWLGNPMIYVEGALDHRRRDPSPVELAIARALRE